MKVLLVTPSYPPFHGGFQLLAQRLAETWPGVPPTVITVGGRPELEYDRTRLANVIRVPPAPAGGMPVTMTVVALRTLARAAHVRPDIVISMHLSASPAAIALRAAGVPFIQYAYGTELRLRPRLARLAFSTANRIVVISRYTRDLAESLGAPSAKIDVIEPGVDTPRPADVARATRPTVVTVARLDDVHKGHDVMLDAIGIVRRQIADVHWLVIGDGRLRPGLEARAADLGLAAHVTFLGRLTDRERDHRLASAHVFAMPSRIDPGGSVEGYGIAYVEASALGLPVVGGDIAGSRDAVRQGETGILVDPTDSSAVAAALAGLLGDPARRERMGEAGRRKAAAQAWPLMAAQVEAVARRVTRG
jgi:phosphatidylinositol alpha-1,6-mannosyltransferase